MADPYLTNSGNLRKFLSHLQNAGVPSTLTNKELESRGFKSKNDRPIINMLKTLGFVDSSNAPTQRWRDYKNKENAPRVMAQAIQEAYGDLFRTYPDAHRRDDQALRNFFNPRTSAGEQVVALTVRTFKTLCEVANFEGVAAPGAGMPDEKPAQHQRTPPSTDRPLTVNINIQLQVPATEDASIYDKLFEALKKHFP